MNLFVRSQRYGADVYSSHAGMTEEMVRRLLTELGHTEIELIFEAEYRAAQIPVE